MIGVLICGLATFLFGGMLLILIFGAQSREAEREAARRDARQARLHLARIPRFFVVNQPARPQGEKPHDAFAAQLEQYLEAEQVLADQFVSEPSLESLYRDSDTRLTWH
jgi:hypothetical protein